VTAATERKDYHCPMVASNHFLHTFHSCVLDFCTRNAASVSMA
jgi:hypothetical protein